MKPNQIAVGSPEQKERYEKIGDFAAQLGLMLCEWTRMQENLGILYSSILSDDSTSDKGLELWHKNQSDRGQRQMLRCLIASEEHKTVLGRCPKSRKDVEWVLDKIDNEISKERNNLAHAVYILTEGAAAPDYIFRNPKSKNLMGKDLIGCARWCRDVCFALAGFEWAMFGGFNFNCPPSMPGPFEWPDRPDLPKREHY